MHATTARPGVERAHEFSGASPEDPSMNSKADANVVATWPAAVGRCALLAMAVCTVFGLAEPELMTAAPHTVTPVLLGLVQIGLGEHVIHDRPTFGWRTAFVVDLAFLPTIVATWVAADYAGWAVVIAAAMLVPIWLYCAVVWCRPEGRRRNATATRSCAHTVVEGGYR